MSAAQAIAPLTRGEAAGAFLSEHAQRDPCIDSGKRLARLLIGDDHDELGLIKPRTLDCERHSIDRPTDPLRLLEDGYDDRQ